MCGFSGFIYKQDISLPYQKVLEDMGQGIYSRGPDSGGIWFDESVGIGLSHRRLAIQDLSPAGHQPMISDSERYVLVFNGEIYNHLDIRASLNAEAKEELIWKGHSDTETLLRGVEAWGLEETLRQSVGMFAIALWDREAKTLQLARDRFGEKPLYYSEQNDMFIFGSELKSFRAHPKFIADISRDSMTLLLRHNCIPAPYSIYNNVYKLMPGKIATYSGEGVSQTTYWDPEKSFNNQTRDKSIEDLEATLKAAVKRQMLSDVPLGAFLSGGIDSSLIVSLMQEQSDKPIKTFSIGFEDKAFNEAEFAKEVANHLKTEHTEVYVSPEEALSVIDKLADIYDEPFSDSSQIPTYLVANKAREYVTVALSGDAGDELFCGYNRYIYTDKVWSKLSKIPLPLRQLGSKLVSSISERVWDKVGSALPAKAKMSNFGAKMHKASDVLGCKNADELYINLTSHWKNPEQVILGSREPATVVSDLSAHPKVDSSVEKMMALDTLSYMTDDILVKVDRAAMANSLETRVPFLDHTVFEMAWRLPLNEKLKDGVSKSCLREILYKYVPKDLIERPKSGFAIPLAQWLQGPLVEWADKLLDKDRLIQEGYFNADIVSEMWQEHRSGKKNHQYHLWDILMFQLWLEKNH
ncbi:asparagine synthase [Pseudoalteromonas luteoviolacea]|uniref:asparagine synthase (glutamine-hydrolyzing) n=1 Tax=Pseudoalteromonas luteoviolacea TaxID=43657 RepID=A0A0C1QF57_9GAMM|nr:asparagine synthase (glutamine-hydrolyzing) [Pseudoalteromonas luteoviolacea]KID57955.1 asparagine synthase [Pseudoalteromonas luteoviolacea]